MMIKKTIIHYLDSSHKAVEYWEKKRIDGNYTEWVDDETIFNHICETENIDMSKHFLIEIFCKGGSNYYFYNKGCH